MSADLMLMMSDAPTRQTFGRSSRLLKSRDYDAVMRTRLRIGGQMFMGHARPRTTSSAWRLGLIVPKKFEPSAVRRNALKRVWRDLFRRELPDLEALQRGHDLVIRLSSRPAQGALMPLKRACLGEAEVILAQLRARLK